MTMQQMVEEFEKRGFKVSKSHISSEKKYRFDISKDGLGMAGYFVYPADEAPDYRDYLQKEFINNMDLNFVEKFNKRKKEKKEMNMFDRHFPVVYYGHNDTQVTCDIQEHYSNPKAAIYNVRKDNPFAIRKVVFNNPATIVLWTDGTKTIVKAGEGEKYDAEKGLAMAIAKKALGNKGNYYDVIRKWVDDYMDQLFAETMAAMMGDGE